MVDLTLDKPTKIDKNQKKKGPLNHMALENIFEAIL